LLQIDKETKMILPSTDMVAMALPQYHLLSVAALILFTYLISQHWIRARRFRAFASANGCNDAAKRRQRWWMFGADTIYESWRWKKEHSYLELLQKNFNDYGKTYTSKVLGVNKITTIEPANIEAILKTNSEDFIARPARKIPLDGLVGPGVLTADGALWKTHRKLMMPSFSKKALEDLSIYSDHFDRFLGHLPRDGEVVDLQDLFFRLTMDSSTAHLLGCSSNTLATTSEVSPEPELAGAFDRAQRAAVEKFALGWADRFRPQPQYRRDTKRVWEFAERYVNIALKRKRERKSLGHAKPDVKVRQANFLDEICERTDNSDDIHKGALHLLVAGRDSTASLLSNLWFMLARDERVWLKLKKEVDALQGAVPDNESVKQVPYLRACINESLRCHPAM
jgi:cytochrome P450